MSGIQLAQSSQGELAAIVALLVLACIVGAVAARRYAPAVSVGLAGLLVAGSLAFFISAADGRRGVIEHVVIYASAGLAMGGLLGLAFLRARGPVAPLRIAAIIVAASAPVTGLVALVSLQHACPLYVTRGSGYCYHTHDVLGGWTAGAAIALTLDLLVVAFLLAISARQSRLAIEDAALLRPLSARP